MIWHYRHAFMPDCNMNTDRFAVDFVVCCLIVSTCRLLPLLCLRFGALHLRQVVARVCSRFALMLSELSNESITAPGGIHLFFIKISIM